MRERAHEREREKDTEGERERERESKSEYQHRSLINRLVCALTTYLRDPCTSEAPGLNPIVRLYHARSRVRNALFTSPTSDVDSLEISSRKQDMSLAVGAIPGRNVPHVPRNSFSTKDYQP